MMARSVVRPVVLAVWAWLALSLPVLAQGVGAIGGTVTDASGAVLPGVTLTLISPGVIGSGQVTVSDGSGAYEFTRLVPGTYSVKAELTGFQTIIQGKINVDADRTARVDLKLAVGDVQETVTVSGATPLLDTTSALKQTELTRETLDSVPTGHDVLSITRLVPSIENSSYDVGGRGQPDGSNVMVHGSIPKEQGYLIDGLDVTSPQESSANLFFDTFVAQEVNVQAGQTPADQYKGGVLMNVITKTGTNNLTISGMYEGTSHALEGNNVSDPALRAQLLNGVPAKALAANPNLIPGSFLAPGGLFDSAFTAGGPIVKDRLWFLGSERYGAEYRYDVGDYNVDGTQLLDDNTLTNLFGKASWAITPSAQLHSLVTWERKFQGHTNDANTTQFTDEQSTKRNDARVWVGIERYTQVLSPRMVFDVAGSWQSQQNDKPPQPGVPNGTIPRFDSVTQTITQASPTYSLPTHGYKQQVRPSVTYIAGNHDLKVGYQFTRSERVTHFESISNFPSGLQEVFANGVPTSVHTYNTPTGTTYYNLDHALFAQDKWRVARKLTVNLGLRVEHDFERLNDGTSPICQPATPFIAQQCFPAISGVPDLWFVSPRSAVIYDLFGDGRTALKFGANRYIMSLVGLTDLINPIKLASDTRTWNGSVDSNGFPTNLGPSSGFNIGSSNHVDPNMKVPYVNELAAGIEQQLRSDMVVSANYTYRARRQVIGATNLAIPTSTYIPLTVTEASSGQTVTVYNVAPALRGMNNTVYTNNPELNDSYNGVDLVFQKRMANHWMALSSLSLGKTVGDINTNTNGMNPADQNNPNFTFRRGPFASDVPKLFKLTGTYEFPYGLRVSAVEQYYTGLPTLTTVLVDSRTAKLTQGSQTVIVAPFGTTRLPSIDTIDLNISKIVTAGKWRFTPQLDIFNLFNAAAITSEVTQLGPTYGNAITLLGSRLVKFGVNFTF
jgi:hypothetical protein